MQRYVSFGIPNYHSLLQEIELECRYLVGSYIHVDPLYISVQCTPHLDLIAHGRKKTKFFLYIFAAYGCIFVSSMGMVVLVILVDID